MDLESTRSRITFPASIANEGFIARVNQFMGLEMALSDELLCTALKAADKRSLTSLIGVL